MEADRAWSRLKVRRRVSFTLKSNIQSIKKGRTVESTQVARKTVLIRIDELGSMFHSIIEKGPGAILVLLPDDINHPSFPANVSADQLTKIHDAERK